MIKIWEYVKENAKLLIETLLFIGIVVYLFWMPPLHKENPVLKDFKDGIQNHLTWSIKGECFFVRPNDEVTVYLVRVPDCDKK
jgi:hypothetical protein